MSGFDNETVYCNNYDFRGVQPVVAQVTTAGQLPIGTGGSPAILVGTLTSPNGTIDIGYSSPDITLDVDSTQLDIIGQSGSKVIVSGTQLIVKSPEYSDRGGSTTVTVNSGSFATAAITLTLPVSAGLINGDQFEFVATNGVLVIQLQAGQVGHLGSVATSSGGTFTSTATGDSISLRYQVSTNDFWATCSVGVWVLA